MIGPAGGGEAGRLRVDFLACPAEPLLDDFIHRPDQIEADLVKAVSRHLARCPSCRDEADRERRGREESAARRPWLWAGVALALLGAATLLFVSRELPDLAGATSAGESARPDPRLAALARFEPPSEANLAPLARGGPRSSSAMPPGPLETEDQRELAVARESLSSGRFADGARLLEDLVLRHPERTGLRLLLAFALARSGEFEKAWRQYQIAELAGAGDEACRGLLNASLKVGDLATARHELAAHLLERYPEDLPLRDLLSRIDSYRQTR